MIRRSVTIRPELDARIKDLVVACSRHGVSMDYTRAINLLAELGESWLEESCEPERDKFTDVFSKYMDYSVFEESVKGDWVELQEQRRWMLARASQESEKHE